MLKGNQVFSHPTEHCECKLPDNEKLEHYSLVGDIQLADWYETMRQCKAILEEDDGQP